MHSAKNIVGFVLVFTVSVTHSEDYKITVNIRKLNEKCIVSPNHTLSRGVIFKLDIQSNFFINESMSKWKYGRNTRSGIAFADLQDTSVRAVYERISDGPQNASFMFEISHISKAVNSMDGRWHFQFYVYNTPLNNGQFWHKVESCQSVNCSALVRIVLESAPENIVMHSAPIVYGNNITGEDLRSFNNNDNQLNVVAILVGLVSGVIVLAQTIYIVCLKTNGFSAVRPIQRSDTTETICINDKARDIAKRPPLPLPDEYITEKVSSPRFESKQNAYCTMARNLPEASQSNSNDPTSPKLPKKISQTVPRIPPTLTPKPVREVERLKLPMTLPHPTSKPFKMSTNLSPPPVMSPKPRRNPPLKTDDVKDHHDSSDEEWQYEKLHPMIKYLSK